ncbi:MAG: ABC transporter ATP-binding protein [Candidatus Micrarchaeota archaeon]|nr:ABC transporter ATP-binding protein [Candidatus Micrarchaeota archaeon]
MGETGFSALEDITMSIPRGEWISIMGRSGSGKSTLLHIMGCLDIPTEGRVYINGIDTSEMDSNELARVRRENLGFVFQQFHLIPTLTALQNVALPMMFTGTPKAEREERAAKILDSLGLAERMTHLPNELSGGEKQRVAIARSLANNPEIILADEPTGNLDTRAGEELLKIFGSLHKKENKTLIVVTHDKDVAAKGEKVIYMQDGQLVKGKI